VDAQYGYEMWMQAITDAFCIHMQNQSGGAFMLRQSLTKLAWGFALIMVDIVINGFDLLPDIIGYILFVLALGELERRSECFDKARPLSIVLAVLSAFEIHRGLLVLIGPIKYLIALATICLNLLVVYYIFMGMKEMCVMSGQRALAGESDQLWKYYMGLALAGLAVFLLSGIPFFAFIGIVLVVANIVLLVFILRFLNSCGSLVR